MSRNFKELASKELQRLVLNKDWCDAKLIHENSAKRQRNWWIKNGNTIITKQLHTHLETRLSWDRQWHLLGLFVFPLRWTAASMNTNRTRGWLQQLVYIDLEFSATHLTDPSVSHPAGLRRSFRLGRKSSWVREAARAKRWSTGVNGSNPPPTYREVIPYRRDPEDGHRLVVLVGGYEQKKQCGWKHLRKVSWRPSVTPAGTPARAFLTPRYPGSPLGLKMEQEGPRQEGWIIDEGRESDRADREHDPSQCQPSILSSN